MPRYEDSYCTSLTDAQVENVLCDEADRINRHPHGPTSVVSAARTLYHDARERLIERSRDPDMILREHGIRCPSF